MVRRLSGGNQQRLLLSFLPPSPRLLLLENPTRGLDVTSVHWAWEHLLQYAAQKAAIVFSSSELDEILMVADRVLVFFNGGLIKDVPAHQTDARSLGLAIAGRQ
jgi:simple sugar transport system ATP-binding protein